MKIEYMASIGEINLRYVLIHSINNLDESLNHIFKDLAYLSYDIKDISNFFYSDIISINHNNMLLSVVEIQVFNMPYSSVKEFEDALSDVDEILDLCKTYDSFKVEENREYFMELYNIEMKIREVYTVLARLQGANLKNSRVKLLNKYQDNEENFKKRLMNEFFFIGFSDYKNVDKRKDTKLEELLDALSQVERLKDISNVVIELSHSTLRLEERFNELSQVPKAIGKLENFRNNIAHNRYISKNDIENFKKAKDIIDDVHSEFLTKSKSGEI